MNGGFRWAKKLQWIYRVEIEIQNSKFKKHYNEDEEILFNLNFKFEIKNYKEIEEIYF